MFGKSVRDFTTLKLVVLLVAIVASQGLAAGSASAEKGADCAWTSVFMG